MLWFTNTILHVFGWSIVIVVDNNEVLKVYPAKVKFRGFSGDANDKGYRRVSQYLYENVDKLLEEVLDD